MHPRLQTSFDVMYSRAERFIPKALQIEGTDWMKERDYSFAAGCAADALLKAKLTPSNAQAHRSAETAFGAFWNVFTELSYGVKEGK